MKSDKESIQRLPFLQRKEVALKMLKLRCTYEEIRNATGISFTTLCKWKKRLPDKYRKDFKNGVGGLYLRSKNPHNLRIAQSILHDIKVASSSLSQIEGIAKLEPLIGIIERYFAVPDSHKAKFVKSIEESSKVILSDYENSLVSVIAKR